MKSREKNLYFCCLLLLLFAVFNGLKFVDSALTRLLAPDEAYRTAAVSYEQGFVLAGAKERYYLPVLKLGALSFEDDWLLLSWGKRTLKLPRYINLGSLGRGTLKDVDKMPP